MFLERYGGEERGPGTQWKNCGSEVVKKTRQGQFHGAYCSARSRLGFEDFNAESCLRENNGRGQSIRPRTDHASTIRHESTLSTRFYTTSRVLPCESPLYSRGRTFGHSVTWMLPSDSRSSVGAYKPRN